MERYDALVNEKNDLFGRLKTLLEEVPPHFLMLGLVLVLVVLALGLFGRRRELLFLLITSAMLSGAMWKGIDTGSTLFRWILLALLAANVLRMHTYFGLPMLLFLMYVFLGFGLIAFSSVFMWSLQTGGLFLITSLAAVALADEMKDVKGVRRILIFYLIGTLVWIFLGATSLNRLVAAKEAQEIGRFSGAIVSVVVFATVGGLMLPISVWAALNDRFSMVVRLLTGLMAMFIVVMLFSSGERSGTFAGILGTVPILARKRIAGLAFVVGAVVVLGLAGMQLGRVNQKQWKYRLERFTSTDLTGRNQIWSDAVYECMQKPWMGHGLGSDREFALKYLRPTHNAYLSAWYTHGIFGLLLYIGAIVAAMWQSLIVMWRGRTQEERDIGRVLLGVLIVEAAIGMFDTFSSPSNFATITMVLVFVMVGRMSALIKAPLPSTAHAGNYYWAWVPQVTAGTGIQGAAVATGPVAGGQAGSRPRIQVKMGRAVGRAPTPRPQGA
ncbi:MAG: O-antigen ligase family protein [Pirellulales bacterium]